MSSKCGFIIKIIASVLLFLFALTFFGAAISHHDLRLGILSFVTAAVFVWIVPVENKL